MPALDTPRHSSTEIWITREMERYGLMARFDVGMIVGSSSKGTAKPPDVPVRESARAFVSASCSSGVIHEPASCLPNARL